MNVALCATVQLKSQPRVHSTEGQVASLVRFLDLGHVLKHPEQLADGGVCGKGKTAARCQFTGTEAVFEFANEVLRAGISPNNGVVQRLPGGLVPDNGCLTLISDTNGLDLIARVTLVLEYLDSGINACLDRGDELLRVMLMPSSGNCVSN